MISPAGFSVIAEEPVGQQGPRVMIVGRHANRGWALALLVVVASIGLSLADSQPQLRPLTYAS